MKKLLLLIILNNFLFISAAFASEIKDVSSRSKGNDAYKLFDINIFSLSKKNEDAFDAASSIYVLSSEDLRRSGATSIPEALRLVPGLQVARIDGHKWAISARGFNSQFSNKLLVMIDGRTVYTPLFSGAVWDVQDYVLEDVEKIEVIRGSGGAIWGANAVNGIINIITKNSADTKGSYFSTIVGNQDRLISEARYGGATKDRNHYRLYAKQVVRDELDGLNSGVGNDDGYRQSQVGFRYDLRSIKDNMIKIHGDVRDGKANSYFNLTDSAAESTDKDSKGGNLTVNWDKTLSDKSNFVLQAYLDYDQFSTYILERDGITADVDFQYFYDFNRHHQVVFGLGYRSIMDEIKERSLNNGVIPLDYSPDKRDDQIFSTFLQDKIGLIDDVLYLTVGSKFERNDYTGFEFQPSAKLTLLPAENQTAWASISRAVRTPTRGEDSIRIKNPVAPGAGFVLQAGDSQYESENVIAYELGYRIKPTRSSLIDIAVFYNDYSDLRTFNTINSIATTTNFGSGNSFGTEITAKWQVLPGWRLEAGYDFLHMDVVNDNASDENALFPAHFAEGQSPKNQFRLRSNYDITPKVEFDNILYYVDSTPLSKSASASDLGIGSYVRLDTRLGYAINSHVDLSLGIQNITDDKHQEFDNGLFANETEIGRTFYIKGAFKFW
ncbi:MAG: iron complex outermembrane receptor protein [Lentimonas sp.]|jgi:iron complex outermembrane receptor protein